MNGRTQPRTGSSPSEIVQAVLHEARSTLPEAAAVALARGGKNVHQLWLANALAVTGLPSLALEFSEMHGVESIGADPPLHAWTSPPAAERSGSTDNWNLEAVNASAMRAMGFNGNGAVVAALDTGVDLAAPDLDATWRGGTNSWFDPWDSSSMPYDSSPGSHGTGVMSLMAAGNATGSWVGVAPGSQWIAARLFDGEGDSSLSVVLRCYGWLLDPDNDPQTDDFPVVVNNSWGYDQYPGECPVSLSEIIGIFKSAGIAMVFAAGNTGPQSSTSVSPADNLHALAVGGSTSSGTVMINSARGPSACDGRIFPDIVAPGQSVTVVDAFGATTASGTSFAAPHVSGSVAVLASALPHALKNDQGALDIQLIEQALAATARDIAPAGPDNDTGAGLLDVLAAYGYLLDHLEICRSDMNGDRQVDQTDYTLFMAEVESGQVSDCFDNHCPGDFNLDGRVDLRDLAVLRTEIGSSCPLR